MSSILVVDDEAYFRKRLIKALQRRDFEVYGAGDYESALEILENESIEKAIVDLKMPGRSGLDLIRTVNELGLSVQMIVLTGYGSIATAIEAVQLGALGYVSKPADADEILAAFQKHEPHSSPAPQQTEEITAPSLARVEWEHINRVLRDCDGNVTRAAKRLGLHRRSLQRKLLKYPPRE